MPQSTQGTPGSFGYNDQGQLINSAQPTNYILAFILGALQSGLAAIASAIGGGTTPTNATGRILTATAGQTKSIPPGATSVGVIVLTGTATFGGDALPVGTPVNFAGPVVATDVVFANPGTGIVTYQS